MYSLCACSPAHFSAHVHGCLYSITEMVRLRETKRLQVVAWFRKINLWIWIGNNAHMVQVLSLSVETFSLIYIPYNRTIFILQLECCVITSRCCLLYIQCTHWIEMIHLISPLFMFWTVCVDPCVKLFKWLFFTSLHIIYIILTYIQYTLHQLVQMLHWRDMTCRALKAE